MRGRNGTWIEAAIGQPAPVESASTCEACPQVGRGFSADLLCCGFLPVLPNFSVGGLLADPDLEQGADSARTRMAERVATSPLGLGCPPAWAAAWKAAPFGSAPSLRCPHFLVGSEPGRQCSIWPYREATCTTWFCHMDAGEASRRFWLEARGLLQAVERCLARWCAGQLGAEPGPPPSWGPWAERREAFFVACSERVTALTWGEILQIGGFELRTRVRHLRLAHRALSNPEGDTDLDEWL